MVKIFDKKTDWKKILRYTLYIFLPLTLLLVVFTFQIYKSEYKAQINNLKGDEGGLVSTLSEIIADDFESIVSDITVLSQSHELEEFIYNKEGKKGMLGGLFLDYSRGKKLYDQIRFLDKDGMELVRVNFNNGSPAVVLENKLQSKKDRYYFTDTFKLKQGELFISPFDLNIEGGVIEYPLKPIIRFAVPIFNDNGVREGILVLNYLGSEILDNFVRVADQSKGRTMLLNSDGFYFRGMKSEEEWGFMYDNRQNGNFANSFPEVWQKMGEENSGQLSNSDGFFSFKTMLPISKIQKSIETDKIVYLNGKKYSWKIVSYVSSEILKGGLVGFVRTILIIDFFVLILILFSSYSLAKARVKYLSSKEAKEEAFKSLELMVKERTIEIRDINNDLKNEINRRKDIEDILERSREKMEAILQAVPNGMTIIDEQSNIVWMNNILLDKFGQEAIGEKCYEIYREDKKQCMDCPIKQGIKIGGVEMNVRPEFFDNRIEEVTSIGVNLEGKKCLLEVFNDITDRKRAEEKSKSLGKLKSKFIKIISHQVRTPLTGIRWGLENLLGGAFGKFEKVQEESIRSVYRTTENIIDRLRYLLDIMDIKDGHISLNKEIFSLEDLWKTVLDSFKNKAKLKNIDFDYQPPKKELERVFVDRNKILDIFNHLMKNAIEYNKGDGKIKVRLSEKNNKIRFEVEDTGIGIPKSEQSHIFTPFFRASNALVAETDRSGIGLSIAKAYIEKHDGKIGFKSTEGKGSTFWFEIPVHEE